ncbi:MAG: site-specific integrase [Methylocella sp.]
MTKGLTKRTIDALAPREKSYIVFDGKLAGFGLRVAPSGIKTFVVEYRPHGGGRAIAKKRLTIGAYGPLTPDQARKAATEALSTVRHGRDPQAEKDERRRALTISDLIDAFAAEHIATKCKPRTAQGYVASLEILRRQHGLAKAESLTRAQVAKMHANLAETPFTANRFLATLSKCFSWGVDRQLLPDGHLNPAIRVQRYAESARERYMSIAELARLGDVLREGETIGLEWSPDETKAKANHAPKSENRRTVLDPFAAAAIRLLILTGARLREILHARWEYVDFERGVIRLPDSKTGAKPIYLSAAALAVLAALPRIAGNPHLIPGDREGEPRSDLKRPWAAVIKAAGLGGLRIHDLRHSFASVGAGASLGLPIIGKLLGHSQPATTARYAHLDADPMRRAVESIGATISVAMGENVSENVVVRLRRE